MALARQVTCGHARPGGGPGFRSAPGFFASVMLEAAFGLGDALHEAVVSRGTLFREMRPDGLNYHTTTGASKSPGAIWYFFQ